MKKNKIILITVAPVSHRTAEENLGLGYLASVLRNNGFLVDIIDAWLNDISDEEIVSIITGTKHILTVGFSCYQSNIERSIALQKQLKSEIPDLITICGGFGPTFNPDKFLHNGFDYILRGEGEITIVNLCNYLTTNHGTPNKIAGISYWSHGQIIHNPPEKLIEDLDTLPFPSRETMQLSKERKSCINLLTARGCMGHCLFCSVVSFFHLSPGNRWRTRSIKNIVDELEILYNNGIRHIKIIDDSFIEASRDELWCNMFADEIHKRHINVMLRGSIRADKVTDGILKALKRAGFFSFSCGIENGSDNALKRMNKSAGLKQNISALDSFKKYNYFVQAGFILFDNKTTFSELKENYEFLSRYRWTITKGIFSEMYAAEGTPFTKKLLNINALDDCSNVNKSYAIDDRKSVLAYLGLKQWHKAHMYLYDKAIDPLTSPKALDLSEINAYYHFYRLLKDRDLSFFKDLLGYIDQKEDSLPSDIENYTASYYKKNKHFFNDIDKQVDILYAANNMEYTADVNPFII